MARVARNFLIYQQFSPLFILLFAPMHAHFQFFCLPLLRAPHCSENYEFSLAQQLQFKNFLSLFFPSLTANKDDENDFWKEFDGSDNSDGGEGKKRFFFC
jgi:hypothetical protein